MENKDKPSRQDRLEGVVQRTRQAAQSGSDKVTEKIDAITPEGVQRVARAARGKASEAVSTLTGTNIEEEVSELSELYTQVLLGIHQDVANQAESLARLDEEIVELRRQDRLGIHQDVANQAESLAHLDEEMVELRRQARFLRAWQVIAAVAIVLSVVSLGGVVWLAL